MKKFTLTRSAAAAGACLLLAACGEPAIDADDEELEDKHAALREVLNFYDDADRARVVRYLTEEENVTALNNRITASELLRMANEDYYRSSKEKSDEFLAVALSAFEYRAADYTYDRVKLLPCGPNAAAATATAEEPAPASAAADKPDPRRRMEELFKNLSYDWKPDPGVPGGVLVTLRNGSAAEVAELTFAAGDALSAAVKIEGGLAPGGETVVKAAFYDDEAVKKGAWLRIDRVVFRDAENRANYIVRPYNEGSPGRIVIGGSNDREFARFLAEKRRRLSEDRAKNPGADACPGDEEYAAKVRNKLTELTKGVEQKTFRGSIGR